MPIPTSIADLSATASSNSPAGSESPTEGDNYIRALSAIIRQNYDAYADTASTAAGDALIGVKISATGSVGRTQHSKNEDAISIKDFGAVMDASTDDSAAIQAAHDSLPSGGGTIIIPQGGMVIASTLTFSKPITLRGNSKENTNGTRILKASTLNGPAILVTGSNVTIENLALVGQAGNGGDGIVLTGVQWTLQNVNVSSMGNDGIRVGDSSVGTNSNIGTMIGVASVTNGRHGFYLDSLTTDAGGAAFVNCFAYLNTGDGFKLDRSQLNTFVGCVSEGNTGYGLNFGDGARDDLWFGGDSEANTAGNYTKHANALRCNVIATWTGVNLTIGARVKNSGAQTLTTATVTALTFDTETIDTDGIHSTSSNTSRLTPTTPGQYRIAGCVGFASNATGFRSVGIRLNGTTFLAVHSQPAVNGDVTNINVSTTYNLAVGDYIELTAYQNSGGNLDTVVLGDATPVFSMIREN